MNLWLAFVEVVRFALFATAHVLGGSIGAGILAFSLALRVAMLPLTISATRKMREQQARLRRLAPELKQVSKQFKTDPVRLQKETAALYQKNGVSMAPTGMRAALVQWPIGAAIYNSLRSGVA